MIQDKIDKIINSKLIPIQKLNQLLKLQKKTNGDNYNLIEKAFNKLSKNEIKNINKLLKQDNKNN
jgi:hypothetical protein